MNVAIAIYFMVYMGILVCSLGFFLVCEGLTSYRNGRVDRLVKLIRLSEDSEDE